MNTSTLQLFRILRKAQYYRSECFAYPKRTEIANDISQAID